MASADPVVVHLRQCAREAVDVDEFLLAAEAAFDEDLGTCHLWVATATGPGRCHIQARSFDPLVDGLTGVISQGSHVAVQALATEVPLWADSPTAIDDAAPTYGATWREELDARSLWVVPAQDVALVGLGSRAGCLSASARARLTAAAEIAALLQRDSARPAMKQAIQSLSARQALIAHFIARGMSNGAIAAELEVSAATVAADAAVAMTAMGLTSREMLAAALATDFLLDEVG